MSDLFRILPRAEALGRVGLQALAEQREFFETPGPAARAMLAAELFTPVIWDPCCGSCALSREIERAGYQVVATDVENWGHGERRDLDFLSDAAWDELRLSLPEEFSIVMNPPFSLAVAFVERALKLGARKIAVFQRLAWWEGKERVETFWRRNPPVRWYGFDGRVTSWRGDIPPGDRKGGSPTAHAWFIWEANQPPGPIAWHLRLAA
jgi:hypothetical protein